MASVTQLDVRKLLCPFPVIRLQQAIKQVQPGDRLEVKATDKGVLHDIPAWCRIHGHTVISSTENAGIIELIIEK